MRQRLTDVLKAWGRIDDRMEALAVDVHRRLGTRIGAALINLGFCARMDIVDALAAQAGLSAVDLTRVSPDPLAVRLVPRKIAERYGVVPLRIGGRDRTSLAVAIAAPVRLDALDAIRALTGRRVVAFVADEDQLGPALNRAYASDAERAGRAEIDLGESDDETPLVTVPLALCVGGV